MSFLAYWQELSLGHSPEERGRDGEQGGEAAAAHADDHGVFGGLGGEDALEVALPGDPPGGQEEHGVHPRAPVGRADGADPVDGADGGHGRMVHGEGEGGDLNRTERFA